MKVFVIVAIVAFFAWIRSVLINKKCGNCDYWEHDPKNFSGSIDKKTGKKYGRCDNYEDFDAHDPACGFDTAEDFYCAGWKKKKKKK